MRATNAQWIGEIPSHWKLLRMKNIFQNVSEKNHPDATVLSLYRDYGVLPKDSRDDNHNVTSENTGAYKYVRINDLVINKMKAWQGSLGISQYEGIVSPAYYVCHFIKEDVSTRYFHYLLRSKSYAQEFERLSTGMRVGQWDLGIDDFMRVPVIIPPYEEQMSIAAYLDDQISMIDSIIKDAKTSIEEYERWKAAIIYEAVTKGVRKPRKTRESGIDILGEISNNWGLKRLKFLCEISTGNQDTQDAEPDGLYPFYVRSPIIERSNKFTFEGEGILMAGDGAGAGRVFHHAFGKYAIHQRVYCLHHFKGIKPRFLYYFMSNRFSVEMDKGSAKSTVPSVRLPMLQNFRVCIPSDDEQDEIIEYLDSKVAEIDAVISSKEDAIMDLEKYKRSLIHEAVTGKRKVV